MSSAVAIIRTHRSDRAPPPTASRRSTGGAGAPQGRRRQSRTAKANALHDRRARRPWRRSHAPAPAARRGPRRRYAASALRPGRAGTGAGPGAAISPEGEIGRGPPGQRRRPFQRIRRRQDDPHLVPGVPGPRGRMCARRSMDRGDRRRRTRTAPPTCPADTKPCPGATAPVPTAVAALSPPPPATGDAFGQARLPRDASQDVPPRPATLRRGQAWRRGSGRCAPASRPTSPARRRPARPCPMRRTGRSTPRR